MDLTEGRDALKRLLAVATVAACMAGVTACGSSDDDGGGGDANANADNAAQAGGGAEQQIRTAYEGFLEAIAAKDADAACAAMTDRARKEFTGYELGGQDCEKTLLRLIGDSVQGDNRPTVVGVKIDGDKALARVRTGTGQTVSGVRFAKRDGAWKINGSAVAD